MSFCAPAVAARRPRPVPDEEEDELELPPLDGALDERDAPDDDDDAAGEVAEEEAAADDGALGDIDSGWAIEDLDAVGAEHAGAAPEPLDVGTFADIVAIPERSDPGTDESGPTADAPEDLSPFDAAFDADAGAGTGEDPSAFIDEGALPPLDADEVADRPEAARDAGTSSGAALPWVRSRWRVAAGLGADVPCWLVAVSSARVVAAGPTILIAPDGARAPAGVGPDLDAVALAANDDAIFAVARPGALFASADGGVSWTALGAPWPAGDVALSIAATPGRLWVREGDALWSSRWTPPTPPASPAPLTQPTPLTQPAPIAPPAPIAVRRQGVRAIASAGSALVVLVERGAELHVERLRADDEPAPSEVVPEPTRAAIGEHAPLLAATASGRVIGLHLAGVFHLSRDAGRTFRSFETGPALALAFAGAGDDARALVLVAAGERARDAHLVLLEGQPDGSLARVAEIRGGSPAGRASLAWDAAREVVWVASPSGLVAFERSTQH